MGQGVPIDRMKVGTLKVSSVGIGSLSWSKVENRETIREMMDEAKRLGCNFCDTAERYGASKQMEAMGSDWGGAEKVLSEFVVQKDIHHDHNHHISSPHLPTGKSIKLWRLSSSPSSTLKVATKFSPTPKR